IISYIMRFLNVPDRKEAALVCKRWYNASLDPVLQRDIIVKCRPPENGMFPSFGLLGRKLTHLEFGNWDSKQITESTLMTFLSRCPSLEYLDLSDCNSLFLSGRFLSKDSDLQMLKETLSGVRVLKLNRLRYMTDMVFERLVSVFQNLEDVSIASTHMIFGSDLYSVNQSSPAMLHFSAFLKFVQENAQNLKHIDISYTSVPNEALGSLAMINNLALEKLSLRGCAEISDKGLKNFVTHQHFLKILDISGCRELGSSKDFFKTLANNLPHLHTLIMRKCARMGQCDITSLADFGSLHTLDMGEVLNLFDIDLIKGLCCQVPHLTRLALPFCPDITDAFVVELCKTNYRLAELDLSSCFKLTDISLHAITKSLTSLQVLRLSYCREISDIGILGYLPEKGVVPRSSFDFDHDGCPCSRERDSKIFRKPTGAIREHKHCISKAHNSLENGEDMFMLSNLKSLQVLDLSYCPRITDTGVTEAVRFPELSSLSLNGLPKMKDRAVVAVARHNPILKEVKLSYNMAITDVAVAELMMRCTRLSTLDVSQCGSLTDKCLQIIAAKGNRLRHLDLSFNNLTLREVLAMELYLPKTKILYRPEIV
ncbi:unnamed protein product, partial [Candidula unifasciata]